MNRMFKSATLKLTGWYLIIILLICLLFSFIVYQISSRELAMRLQKQAAVTALQVPAFRGVSTQIEAIFDQQLQEGQRNLKLSLLYTNIGVLLVGGAGSYLLARRTLQPIEDAHAAQSRFTGDVSHELRTPLATMQTEIEVTLRDKSVTKPELIDLLKSNLEEVEKLRGVSDALLRLSQLHEHDMEMENIDIKDVLQEACQRIQQEADSKRITLQLQLSSVSILGNGPVLAEMITILLDNAIKYSPQDSMVELRSYRHSGMAVVKVVDHGIGISRKDLPFIFDRFYRGDSSRSKNEVSGYGLGLSLAEEIASLHDGTITAASSKAGTTFTVRLPVNR
jgi:signal transduction histidine kinase